QLLVDNVMPSLLRLWFLGWLFTENRNIIDSVYICQHAPISLIHHQGIIPAFAGTGSAALLPPPPAFAGAGLRRIDPYASVVAPRRLASNTLLVIRDSEQLLDFSTKCQIRR
ncbi:MAG: hypothetical protein PVJ69_19445, partial [Desulfobacteraceae bacterium]